ncbi:ASCH domain-containing protein [Yersinia hibernica]|uniref:hypothetical protein n=1 Tax=Yersinia hibernica TaxID=2339259 RepID=UPI0011A917EC|nr:hypothetical protein [Yersinia hibernica]
MNEKPILFNAEMVNAILSGRKTQTRRIIKPFPDSPQVLETRTAENGCVFAIHANRSNTQEGRFRWDCPLGKPGDQLWVRENFSGDYEVEGMKPSQWSKFTPIWYWADGNPPFGDWTKPKPSIHMPRTASRINLLITGVRVERLNTISTGDAMAEGYPADREATGGHLDAWLWFRELWDGIYPDNTFEVNPWCWVIEFERMESK